MYQKRTNRANEILNVLFYWCMLPMLLHLLFLFSSIFLLLSFNFCWRNNALQNQYNNEYGLAKHERCVLLVQYSIFSITLTNFKQILMSIKINGRMWSAMLHEKLFMLRVISNSNWSWFMKQFSKLRQVIFSLSQI